MKTRVGWLDVSPVAPYIICLWGAAEKSITSLRGLMLSVQVFCLIKGFRSKSGTYQRQNAALGCGAARGTAVLEGLHGGAVGSWRKEKRSASGSIREGIRVDTYEPRKSRRQLHRHRPGSKEGCRVLGRRNPERAPGSWLGWQRPWRRRRGW